MKIIEMGTFLEGWTHFFETFSFASSTWFWKLLTAYGGGLLASLTPCVYPLIPITIGIVGGFSEPKVMRKKKHFFQTITLSTTIRISTYIFGMALTYAFLGILAALTGKIFGSWTQTSWAYLFIGIVLMLSSFYLLELFQSSPLLLFKKVFHYGKKLYFGKKLFKSSQARETHSKHTSTLSTQEKTLGSIFFLGMSSGLIAAPCTTPLLTAILTWVAQTQSVLLGFSCMFLFALGMGTLLFFIGIFTGWVEFLPKSGHWMQWIKKFSALLLLGAGSYFLYYAGFLKGRGL